MALQDCLKYVQKSIRRVGQEVHLIQYFVLMSVQLDDPRKPHNRQ